MSELTSDSPCAEDHIDSLLTDGLHGLPIVSASSDFDERVLTAVTARSASPRILAAPRTLFLGAGVAAAAVGVVFLVNPRGVEHVENPAVASKPGERTSPSVAPTPASLRSSTALKTVRNSAPTPPPTQYRSAPPTVRMGKPSGSPRLSPPSDDTEYLNPDPVAALSRWIVTPLPGEEQARLAGLARSLRGADDFVQIPLPRVASSASGPTQSEIQALESYQAERQIVDTRLQREVAISAKAIPFSELCRQLSEQAGVELIATRGVADDNITLFCKKRPLRELMREIATVFGFAWERSGQEGAYRYRLSQPLRAQLYEERLRKQDRDAALIALDENLRSRYLSRLSLKPEEARTQAEQAEDKSEQKAALSALGGLGWGPAQLYFALAQEELTALRSGETLRFGESRASAPWGEGGVMLQRPFPAGVDNLEATILRAQAQTTRVGQTNRGTVWIGFGPPESMPDGIAPEAFPGARAVVELQILKKGEGFSLQGSSGVAVERGEFINFQLGTRELAYGAPPEENRPLRNAERNERHRRESWALRKVNLATAPARQRYAFGAPPAADPEGRATTAELLEAAHRATGRDVIGDAFTRLYTARSLSTPSASAFDALSRACDTARLRWESPTEAGFLRFRTPDFYLRRPREVPQRLLARWASTRKEPKAALSLPDVLEIAKDVSDEQLDSAAVAEGAVALYGLAEWELVHSASLRPALRFLASLPASGLWQKGTGEDTVLLPDSLDQAGQQQLWSLTFANNPPSARRPPAADRQRSMFQVYYQPMRKSQTEPAEFTVVFRYGGPITGYRRQSFTRTRSWGEGDTETR